LNSHVYDVVTKLCREDKQISFLNVAVDGLSTKSKFVADNLTKFLLEKASTPVIMDPNHNMKNLLYQVLGGSDVVTCGTSVINLQLLWDAGISEALYRVMD